MKRDELTNTLAASLKGGLGLSEHHSQRVEPLDLARTLFPWGWADYQVEMLLSLLAPDWTRMILLAPPRHRKPLDQETTVISMIDGTYKLLKDVCVGDKIASHRGRATTVTAVHKQGYLPTLEIRTRWGRTIRSAYDHPFLTHRGWINASDLEEDDVLAIVHRPSLDTNFDADALIISKCWMAGYFVGDGSVSSGNCCITNTDSDILADIELHSEIMGWRVRKERNKDWKTGEETNTWNYHILNGARSWLRQVGMIGKTAHTKRVPDFVFKLDNALVACFLAAYFMCDGSMNRRGGKRRDLSVSFSSVNRSLLEDVQKLLLRFGVNSRIYRHKQQHKRRPHISWELHILKKDFTYLFLQQIPIYGNKLEKLLEWNLKPLNFESEYLPDYVISVAKTDECNCRCLSVSRDGSFVANDIAVHNTTIVSLFAACFIGEDPCRRVMVASHTKDFAALLIKSITDIMASPLYHRSYGDLLPKTGDTERWTTYEKHLPHRPVYIRDPTLIALSPDSGTPGYGADLILMDDIVSQANSSSPTMRKHISQWVAGSLLKRLEPDGKFLVIGNRFYPQDYYGEILETKPHWKKLIYTSTPEEPLWPDHWDGAAIQSQRDDDPIFYHGQYLMEPLDLAAAGNFNSEWFQFYTALPPLLSIFSGIDLPITADIGTSKYAEVTMGRDPHGNLYLLDGYSGYHDGDELPTLMDALYRKWQPIEVAWESNGPQATVMKLSAKLVETDVRFYGIPSEIGKDRRLASIAGLVRTGKILVRGVVNEAGKIEPVGIAKVLLKAWDDFPTGDLDLLDAFEKCVCLARKSPPPASASTSGRTIEEQKIAQKQREEKRRARHPRNSKSRYPRVFR